MEFFSNLLYFLIVIGVLVLIHEFGHFIAARLSGMRTDIFSFGMGFRLFGFNKKTGFTFGNLPKSWEPDGTCDYRVSLFPIGGYVKVAGMIDESMDTESMKSDPQPWEFRSKPLLSKVFVLSAGVIMNALLTVAIFSGIFYSEGRYSASTTTVGFVQKGSLAEKIGFMQSDKIIEINNKKVDSWDDVNEYLALDEIGKPRKIKVLRGGESLILNADGKAIIKAIASQKPIGMSPENTKVFLGEVETIKPAGKAGLAPGDTIININGVEIKNLYQFISILESHKSTPISMQWNRNSKFMSDTVIPDADGKIGVQVFEEYAGQKTHITYGFFEAIGLGFQETVKSVNLFIATLQQIFQGNISFKQSIGGPIMIAKMASRNAERGIISFLHFMAILSITLAVINILPFPALDGGHLVFVLIEGIIRREIPLKVKVAFQNVGMIMLLLLMAFVIYNDIAR